MRIVCSAKVYPEISFASGLFQITETKISSYQFLKKVKSFDLIILSWPEKESLFWLRFISSVFPAKKIIVFANLQEANFKLSSYDKKILLSANRIICPNLESIRHGSLSPIYWKAPEKFREIPYGVDSEKYRPKESFLPSENQTVAKFKEIINYVTKKVIRKGLANILISCSNQNEWRDIFNEERLQGKVIYFNWQEDDLIKRVKNYQEGDILVIPKNEGEETVRQIVEALACGLVILAPRSGRLSNVFDHDKQGLFFKPGDHEDLLEKLALLCDDENKREQMSLAARKLADKYYNREQREKKICQIIRELEK